MNPEKERSKASEAVVKMLERAQADPSGSKFNRPFFALFGYRTASKHAKDVQKLNIFKHESLYR